MVGPVPRHYKLRPKDCNISAQNLNIVGHNMLRALGHPAATCCDMAGMGNPTSTHAWLQHCCIQHCCMKFDQFQIKANNTQHVATNRIVWPKQNATLRWNARFAIVWPGLYFRKFAVWSPSQTIATYLHNISQHCWPNISMLQPNMSQHCWAQHVGVMKSGY